MPAGMIINRSGGFIQIDDTYKTLHLREVRTQSITSSSTVSVSFDSNFCMIGCRSEALRHTIWQVSKSGSTWTFTFVFRAPTLITEDVKFYIFGDPVLSGDNYGLQIFDAAGNLTFAHTTKPLRGVQVLNNNENFTGEVGRSYIPLFLGRYDVFITVGPQYDVYQFTLRSSAHFIIWNMDIWTRRGSPVSGVGQYIAADVTGY